MWNLLQIVNVIYRTLFSGDLHLRIDRRTCRAISQSGSNWHKFRLTSSKHFPYGVANVSR